jgi:RNA polymerase-associated protein RTF1
MSSNNDGVDGGGGLFDDEDDEDVYMGIGDVAGSAKAVAGGAASAVISAKAAAAAARANDDRDRRAEERRMKLKEDALRSGGKIKDEGEHDDDNADAIGEKPAWSDSLVIDDDDQDKLDQMNEVDRETLLAERFELLQRYREQTQLVERLRQQRIAAKSSSSTIKKTRTRFHGRSDADEASEDDEDDDDASDEDDEDDSDEGSEDEEDESDEYEEEEVILMISLSS